MNSIKLFATIYIVIMGFIYLLQRKRAMPIIVPGDIYIHQAQKFIYIPLGLTFILTLVVYLILKSIAKQLGVEF